MNRLGKLRLIDKLKQIEDFEESLNEPPELILQIEKPE